MSRLQDDLLSWWVGHRRDLPWRQTRDPWAVLVSETMLQQTQVSRVADRWPRFLERFPTPEACVAAAVGEVVAEWSGLGYNRRAVMLHRAASACVSDHDGLVPEDLGALLALPGVGPYTARAVLVFAFGHDIGLVDTNAGRVVARAVAGRRLRPAEAQALADATVPEGWGWEWGQAVFDLGASMCTKRAPACDPCPVRGSCTWAAAGFPEPDPVEGSAGVSAGQSRFDGSDRQGRGRLVRALADGPLSSGDLAAVMGWPSDPQRAERVAAGVVADGLAVSDGSGYRLP